MLACDKDSGRFISAFSERRHALMRKSSFLRRQLAVHIKSDITYWWEWDNVTKLSYFNFWDVSPTVVTVSLNDGVWKEASVASFASIGLKQQARTYISVPGPPIIIISVSDSMIQKREAHIDIVIGTQ